VAGALPQTPQGELTHTLAGFKGPTSRREEGGEQEKRKRGEEKEGKKRQEREW